jgi:hypothetical protein
MAAAGVPMQIALLVQDTYAWGNSTFDRKEKMDAIYTHSAKQDVEDTKRGYRLYRSGRIRLENE